MSAAGHLSGGREFCFDSYAAAVLHVALVSVSQPRQLTCFWLSVFNAWCLEHQHHGDCGLKKMRIPWSQLSSEGAALASARLAKTLWYETTADFSVHFYMGSVL